MDWLQLLSKHRRSLWALVLCLAGAGLYARTLNATYPIARWLVWDIATLWAWSLMFVLACLAVGLKVLGWLSMPRSAPIETGTLAMATGVTVFTLAMYALGALGWFRAWAATALVVVMVSLGRRELVELGSRFAQSLSSSSERSPMPTLAKAFGALAVLIVYLGIFTPEALNYDATWVHVAIAEDYARQGYLAPFYGDYTRNVPHLASLVYTWAYLVPGLEVPQRWMLALHLEFVLFLWTLVGIAATTRWLLNDQKLGGTWAAFFLFPIIFVYDSNLGGAADHVLAFFAMPLLLTTRVVLRSFAPGPSYLLAILAGGAALTKYQALYLLIPLLPALVVRFINLIRRELRARGMARTGSDDSNLSLLVWTPIVMLGVFLLVFAPHLAKNLYYHQNPVYPFMSGVFEHSSPTVPDAAFYVENVFKDQRWVPAGTFFDKVTHAVRLFFTFSFAPHYSFTKGWPIFGPLFTLLLPALLVVRERRILLAAGTASIALLVWAYTFNVDRNLQVILPYMVCVTAALLVRLWQQGVWARYGVGVLVGFQVIAGADAILYTEQPNLQSTMRLLSSGYEGHATTRYDSFRATHRAIEKVLPKDALVLLHTHHPSLGINRRVVLDWTGHQGLVSYAHIKTVRGLVEYYRSLGVTHLLYVPGEWQASSRKEEVLFNRLTRDYGAKVKAFGPYRLLAVPSQPPTDDQVMSVACLGMFGYSDGLYSVDQMGVNEYMPIPLRVYPPPVKLATSNPERLAIVRAADAVLVGVGFAPPPELSASLRTLQRATGYPGLFTLYLKRTVAFPGARPGPGVGAATPPAVGSGPASSPRTPASHATGTPAPHATGAAPYATGMPLPHATGTPLQQPPGPKRAPNPATQPARVSGARPGPGAGTPAVAPSGAHSEPSR